MFEKCVCGNCDPVKKMPSHEGFAAENGAKLKDDLLTCTSRVLLDRIDDINEALEDGFTFASCIFSVFPIAYEDPAVVARLAEKIDDPDDRVTIQDGLRLLKVLEKHRLAMIAEFNAEVDAINVERKALAEAAATPPIN